MRRRLIDRLTETTFFRVALLIAGIMVVPVLLLGLVMLPVFILASEPSAWPAAALALGGAAGITGWLRAGWGVRNAEHHNVSATLLCLWIGVTTAVAIAGGIAAALAVAGEDWRSFSPWPAALFAAAHALWALEGIGWAQRLTRSYAARKDEAFDAIPALLLFVALGLAVAAGVVTATL